jgi:hypothetical protein
MSHSDQTQAPSPPRATALALLGVFLVMAGVVGYFVIVVRFGGLLPNVRNDPVVIWLVIAAGVALSILGVRRARGRRKIVPAIVLGLSLVLTTAFGAFLYVLLQVPATSGPAIGSAAADFALVDQHGATRRLADFRGRPLLLVFYRGHW